MKYISTSDEEDNDSSEESSGSGSGGSDNEEEKISKKTPIEEVKTAKTLEEVKIQIDQSQAIVEEAAKL